MVLFGLVRPTMACAALPTRTGSEAIRLPNLARKQNNLRRKMGSREIMSMPCSKIGKATFGRERAVDSTAFGTAHLLLSPFSTQACPGASWAQAMAASGPSLGTKGFCALVLAAITR